MFVIFHIQPEMPLLCFLSNQHKAFEKWIQGQTARINGDILRSFYGIVLLFFRELNNYCSRMHTQQPEMGER